MIEILRLLNGVSLSTSRYSKGYYVRCLDKYDLIPQFAKEELSHPLVNKEWLWVAFSSNNDQPLAMLAAAPMIGVASLLRIYATPSVNKSILVGLLRKVLADCLARGYTRYATYLDLNREVEAKLSRIILKAGGRSHGALSLFDGPTDIGEL